MCSRKPKPNTSDVSKKVHAAIRYATCFHHLIEDCEEVKTVDDEAKKKWKSQEKRREGTKRRMVKRVQQFNCRLCGRTSKNPKVRGSKWTENVSEVKQLKW